VEKLTERRGAVPLMELGDHLTSLRVQGSKQRRGAVAGVIVRPALDLAGLHRQQRLRALKRLDLRLFVDTEDRRMRGRVEIEADNVAHFLDQLRVVRQLESLASMRVIAEVVQYATNSHMTTAAGT